MTKLRFVYLGVTLLLMIPAAISQTKIVDNPGPDDRYKADILLVVAHPDDDTAVAAYLARAIFDQHKRVAVVYGTRGDSGPNFVGYEQGQSLGDVREIEGRRALSILGIANVWFLRGPDTPGQDVLHSLETWRHGAALDQVVRIVRLTRPEIILTWLPVYVIGENHDDHQAAGVIATEAFDLAADPLAFPEQVEAPRNRTGIGNYGEGLRPWQPKKLYYFSDAANFDFMNGHGPQYASDEVSPAKGTSYSKIAVDVTAVYTSQNDLGQPQVWNFLKLPVRFVFGKSAVKASTTGDIFEGVTHEPAPMVRHANQEQQSPQPGVSIELAGPFSFYRAFWRAHALEQLPNLLAPEASVNPNDLLYVPLTVFNETAQAKQVTIRTNLPAGWIARSGVTTINVAPHQPYPFQLVVNSPAKEQTTPQLMTISAEEGGNQVASITMKIAALNGSLPN